jgi:hypothetical protein
MTADEKKEIIEALKTIEGLKKKLLELLKK